MGVDEFLRHSANIEFVPLAFGLKAKPGVHQVSEFCSIECSGEHFVLVEVFADDRSVFGIVGIACVDSDVVGNRMRVKQRLNGTACSVLKNRDDEFGFDGVAPSGLPGPREGEVLLDKVEGALNRFVVEFFNPLSHLRGSLTPDYADAFRGGEGEVPAGLAVLFAGALDKSDSLLGRIFWAAAAQRMIAPKESSERVARNGAREAKVLAPAADPLAGRLDAAEVVILGRIEVVVFVAKFESLNGEHRR